LKTILPRKSDYEFDCNASYLIAGGLGGLGRTMALWMTNRGARHLILLTRSGPRSKAAIALIEELKAMGVDVNATPCDISVKESLQSTLSLCSKSMPPIKGCVAGAMVLRVSPL
jgi:NAD(P)-dependent dehydrogenase (short-subunit alcohol dehydrogenase family)